jgi:hypothetical protein
MHSITVPTIPLTRDYLIELFYQIELKDKLARKWRKTCLDPQSLRDAQRALNEIRRERRLAIDLAKTHQFDVHELWHEVDSMLLGCVEV